MILLEWICIAFIFYTRAEVLRLNLLLLWTLFIVLIFFFYFACSGIRSFLFFFYRSSWILALSFQFMLRVLCIKLFVFLWAFATLVFLGVVLAILIIFCDYNILSCDLVYDLFFVLSYYSSLKLMSENFFNFIVLKSLLSSLQALN